MPWKTFWVISEMVDGQKANLQGVGSRIWAARTWWVHFWFRFSQEDFWVVIKKRTLKSNRSIALPRVFGSCSQVPVCFQLWYPKNKGCETWECQRRDKTTLELLFLDLSLHGDHLNLIFYNFLGDLWSLSCCNQSCLSPYFDLWKMFEGSVTCSKTFGWFAI